MDVREATDAEAIVRTLAFCLSSCNRRVKHTSAGVAGVAITIDLMEDILEDDVEVTETIVRGSIVIRSPSLIFRVV